MSTYWVTTSDPERMADPVQALADVREAHQWATQELATVAPRSPREFCLIQERRRLADIAWRLKRRI